jgi:hypothetical protein
MKLASGAASVGTLVLLPGNALAQSTTGGEQNDAATIWLVIAAIAIVIYFIPAIVAFSRRHPNRWPIALVNLIFGGTGLGWSGALIWACNAIHKSPTGSQGGESGLNLFVNDTKTVKLDPPPPPAAAPATSTVEDAMAQLERLKRLAGCWGAG